MALAAFTLIHTAAKDLRLNLTSIFQQSNDFSHQLSNLRAIYAISEIENQVVDGTENLKPQLDGVSLEFELVVATPRQAVPHSLLGMFPSSILEARAMHCVTYLSRFNPVNFV